MILVDSSVWIDYFRGVSTVGTDQLDRLLGIEPVVVGDLILTEVLQGFGTDTAFARALDLMRAFDVVDIGGADIAIQAARNFRTLRGHGITVRKTIDCLIATRCIESGYRLLHSDRDFDPFTVHLGLQTAF
ncbi:PIN domain nuclease [Brevundimonas sp.]|uniref:type II toxin-antitoxin system VapC family toxin n=1 Tax=Brevundimonas sp. TaxID=1871086 RepID=UPI002AB9D75E|nr:PIN domain nuclease [Brevundimonas sp.]MDZ4362218.1 PIN domain nuclease [Brevundimonas sp.]